MLLKEGCPMEIMKSRRGESLATFSMRAHRRAKGMAVVLFLTPQDCLAEAAQRMAKAFPESVTLGLESVRIFDGDHLDEDRMMLFLFRKDDPDILADAMLLENISEAPVQYVLEVQRKVCGLGVANFDTVCLEFCTNSEGKLVTTLTAMLAPLGVPLFGGSAFHTDALTNPEAQFQVAYQGRIYEDACIALFLKNLHGRVILFREIFYGVRPGAPMHLATKVDTQTRRLVELDDRPAADVYSEETGIGRDKILEHVLDRPIGRMLGSEVFVISMRGVEPDGAVDTVKTVNLNDAIYILDSEDYDRIARETSERICKAVPHRMFVFTIECYHRYQYYERHGITDQVVCARSAALGPYYGVVSGGEQLRGQNANQTGLFLVFEGKEGTIHEIE